MSLPSPSEIASALIAREEMPPEKGDIGPQGMEGGFGPPGPQGVMGNPGQDGTNGSDGDLGPAGPQGKQGERGLKGDKGDKGDEGERGIQGVRGETGAAGSGRSLFPRGGGGGGGGSQTAVQVPFTPAGSISSTNVQAAIEEVAAEASGGGGLTDLVTGDNSDFAASVGDWDYVGTGTMSHDAVIGYVIDVDSVTGSLKAIADVDDYAELVIPGTFLKNVTYHALITFAVEEAAGFGGAELRLQFGDDGAADTNAYTPGGDANINGFGSNNGFAPYLVEWTPTADRSAVSIRVIAITAQTFRLGWIRCIAIGNTLGLRVVNPPGAFNADKDVLLFPPSNKQNYDLGQSNQGTVFQFGAIIGMQHIDGSAITLGGGDPPFISDGNTNLDYDVLTGETAGADEVLTADGAGGIAWAAAGSGGGSGSFLSIAKWT